jgi:hypothetical protein
VIFHRLVKLADLKAIIEDFDPLEDNRRLSNVTETSIAGASK